MYNVNIQITERDEVICSVKTERDGGISGRGKNINDAINQLRHNLDAAEKTNEKGYVVLKLGSGTKYLEHHGIAGREFMVETTDSISHIVCGTYLKCGNDILIVRQEPVPKGHDLMGRMVYEFPVIIFTSDMAVYMKREMVERRYAIK